MNILVTFARSSSRVEVAFVRFRLYKRLFLQWATRANATLVYRFHSHSLTHSVFEMAVSAFRVTVFGNAAPVSAFRVTLFGNGVPVSAFRVTVVGNAVLCKTVRSHCFFPLTSFGRDKVSRNCFTGRLRGIGTAFIQASLQMCKVQRLSRNTKSTDESGWIGGEAAGVCGVLVGVVRGGHFLFFSAAPF